MKPGLLATIVTVGVLGGYTSVGQAENWPGFRGPTGLGYAEDGNLPLTWGGPDGTHVLWKGALKGQGHASPIVWEDSVFVCTAYWPPEVREHQKVIPEQHVSCFRVLDGRLLWDTLVPPGPWLRTDFRSGPGGGYAAPTPVTDGSLVYCAFGSSVVAALDFHGKIVWHKAIVPYSFDVTLGSSPILYQDTVILLCAMAKPQDSKVMALNKTNGDVKWEHKLPDTGFGHNTPVIIRVNGKAQMLVLASGMTITEHALQSLNPATGDRLWWARGAGDAASPAYGAGVVYFDSGRGSLGAAVDPTGSEDVSKKDAKWTIAQVSEGISSPIFVGTYLYRLHNPGILKCWDATTGKQIYAERLAGISTTWASPVADAHGRLFFANAGKSYVIESGPKFRVLAVNDLGEGNHPSPAVANGKLFLVGTKNLYCVGKKADRP